MSNIFLESMPPKTLTFYSPLTKFLSQTPTFFSPAALLQNILKALMKTTSCSEQSIEFGRKSRNLNKTKLSQSDEMDVLKFQNHQILGGKMLINITYHSSRLKNCEHVLQFTELYN